MDKPKTLHPRYLSQEERIQIADRLRLGDSIRAIARLLGRDPGTVSREVERNRNPESGGCLPRPAEGRGPAQTPQTAQGGRGHATVGRDRRRLRRHWSPEQIANRLRLDFPDNGDMHASVETIYQAIYLQAIKQELKRAMRQGEPPADPAKAANPRFREPMAMISERPRDRGPGGPGPLGGDLITGSRNKSAIGTLVERTTRFTILHLPDGHDAEHVSRPSSTRYHLPKLLRNSLTWDQGGTRPAQTDRNFCDPTPRGSAARTPTGSCASTSPKAPTSVYPEDYLDAVAEELNDRPRKPSGS